MQFDAIKAKLCERWKANHRRDVTCILDCGRLAHQAIRARLKGEADAGTRRTLRAEVVHDLQAALVDVGCTEAKELSRWVGIYWTCELLGMEIGKALPVATVKAFMPVVRRSAKAETWGLRKGCREFAGELWARAATMRAADVAAEVRAFIYKDRAPRKARAKPSPVEKVLRELAALPELVQRQILAALQKKLTASPAAPIVAEPVAVHQAHQAPPPAPRPAPQPEARPTILGSMFGRKAG